MALNVLAGELPPQWARGYGSGDGDGYGYGSGDGDGYGYGYGSGYGDGDGSGDGDGYGYGYGYGDGDGDGDGYGYGYGSGDGSYWTEVLQGFLTQLPAKARARAKELAEQGAKLCYWRSDKDGKATNGGKCAPVAPGTIHEETGPLHLCARGTLHGTLNPPKWQGERWWIVALMPPFVGDDDKYGSLKREIIGECL